MLANETGTYISSFSLMWPRPSTEPKRIICKVAITESTQKSFIRDWIILK